jgi:hypothetical protein
LIQNNQDYSYASEQFANEIKILNDSSSLSEVFENEILNLTKQAEFKNIQFFINGSGNFTNLEEQERILELCREIILNNSKHTDTRIIHIDFKIDDHDSVAIEISTTQKTKNLDSANKSSTVLRLLDLLDVNYELEEITGGLKYRISSIQEVGTGTSLDSIEIFRNTGLQRFANDMVKYSSVICTLTLLGMFFAKVSAFNLLSLAVEVSIINVITFANLSNNIFPAGLSFAAIGLYASFYLHESTCSNNVFLVWTFNVTLTSIFIGILRIKNKYFRWIPLLLFLGTTLVLPSKLPDNCQDLLLGSIPAIFIIPLLVLFLMRFRAKVIINDTNNLLGIYKNAEDLEIIKNLHEMEFNKTLDYSKQVSLELQDNQISEQTLIKRIELAIQVIRNFLICSEQFESESIRIFYNFVGKRLEFGDYTRIELKGEEFGEDFDSTDLAKTLEIIFQFSKGNPLKIHLVKFPQPAIEIVNDAENEELIKKIVDQVNRELIYPIKISQII